jgi:hypothetical protein
MAKPTATLTPLVRKLVALTDKDERGVRAYLEGRDVLHSTAVAVRAALVLLQHEHLIPACDREQELQPEQEQQS